VEFRLAGGRPPLWNHPTPGNEGGAGFGFTMGASGGSILLGLLSLNMVSPARWTLKAYMGETDAHPTK
jgi:hypothetical protein